MGDIHSSLLYLQNVICLQNETRVARCGLFDHFYTHLVGHKCNIIVGYRHRNLFLQFMSTTELSLPSSHQYPNAFFMFRLFASADTYPPTLPDFKWVMCGLGFHPLFYAFRVRQRFLTVWLHDWFTVTGAHQLKSGHRSHRNLQEESQ